MGVNFGQLGGIRNEMSQTFRFLGRNRLGWPGSCRARGTGALSRGWWSRRLFYGGRYVLFRGRGSDQRLAPCILFRGRSGDENHCMRTNDDDDDEDELV